MASASAEPAPAAPRRLDDGETPPVSLSPARVSAARSVSSTSLVPPITPFDAPTATALRIGESPYPTIEGSAHSADPFGLNAYLMHPEDRMWSYLHLDPAGPVKGQEEAGGVPQSRPAPASVRANPGPVAPVVHCDGTLTAEPEAVSVTQKARDDTFNSRSLTGG